MNTQEAKMNQEKEIAKHIKKLAIYLKIKAEEEFEKYDTNEYNYELPIKKMFGINVEANIVVTRNLSFRLTINATKLTYYADDECSNAIGYGLFYLQYPRSNKTFRQRTIEDYEVSLDVLLGTIKKLQFNKFEGVFQTEPFENGFMFHRFELQKLMLDIPNTFQFLEDDSNIDLSYGNCCVCFENTLKKTPCGHYLCVECHDKIDIIYCECGGHGDECEERCGYRPCPYCRKDLTKEKDDYTP